MSGNNKNKKSPAKLYAAASVIFAVFFLIVQVSCCPFSVFSPGAVKDNEVFESEISLHPGELEIESETGTETAILLQPELTLISRLQIPGQAIDVKTCGGFSYLTNDLGTLFVIDVRDKKSPGIIGSVSEINSANIVIVEGDYAYVSYTEWIKSSQTSDNNDKEQSPQALEAYSICGFKIVDIKDKKNPSVVGDYISGTGQKKFVQGMAIEGNFAYINTTSILDGQTRSSLEIINISDKSDPVFTGSCDIEGQPNGLFVRGNYAYLNNTYFDYYNQRYLEKSNFFVVDISDKENPEIKSSCEVPANSWSVFVNDNYAYLTSSIIEEDTGDYTESLLQIIDVKNPEIPELKGQFSLYGGAWEMDVKDDFLLVSNRAGGISAVNISDAGSPFTAAIFKTGGSSYDVAVSGNYAYIADGFNGFLIISLQKNTPDGTIIEQSVVEDSAPVSIIDIYGDSFGNNIFATSNPVYFSAINSYDPDGKKLIYLWSINGEEIKVETGLYDTNIFYWGKNFKISGPETMEEMAIFFGSPGEYKVELTVSDGFYSSRSISVVSIIEKELPVIPLREHNFDVEIECVLLNKGDVILKDIECYLKTPQDYFPYQTVNSVIPAAGLAFAGNLFDNNRNLLTHFKYDKGATLGKNEELKAGIINNVTMFEYEFKKISTRQTDYEVGDEDLKKYTSEDLFIDIRDPVIADAVKKAAGNEADPVEKAKSIYDYIASRLHYDFARAEDRQYSFMNASEILKAGKGVCADYAILYVAMLRAAGIPARLATGIPVFLILGQKDQEVDLGHAWVEIKLPGYGWIIVDITQEKGFMKTDFFMNLATEKGSGFLHKSKIMDWSNYYYDGFIYSWEGIDFPDVEQKLIYRIKNLSQSDLYYYQELSRLRILPR